MAEMLRYCPACQKDVPAYLFQAEQSCMNCRGVVEYAYIARDRYIRNHKFDFVIADWVAWHWYGYSAEQDLPEFAWCLDHIKRGDTVVDCGAHHGMLSTVFAKAVGADGRVYSYEPSLSNAEIIRKNVELNHLNNVTIRPVGLSSHNGAASFYLDNGNLRIGGEEEFKVVRLDDDLTAKKVDFIKIDVEGSDVEAINGAKRILSQRPVIDLELHNFLFEDRMASLEAIFNVLTPLQYNYSVLPEVRGAITKKGGSVDLAWLAQFDNPHVFCTPRGWLARLWR